MIIVPMLQDRSFEEDADSFPPEEIFRHFIVYCKGRQFFDWDSDLNESDAV